MLQKAISAVLLLCVYAVAPPSFAENKDDVSKEFSEAQNLVAQGQLEPAMFIYQELISKNPLIPEVYNNLADIYLKQNKIKQAKQILEQGLHAHKAYGVLYESLTAINVALARDAYSKALQVDLKASNIAIASLSLNKEQNKLVAKNANTIVISQVANTKEKAIPEIKRKEVISLPAVTKVKATTKKIIIEKSSKTIGKALQAWATAWSAQSVSDYLSFYHQQYKSVNGLSFKSWAKTRKYRLKKPKWIKVSLSKAKVIRNSGNQAIVNFQQSYQSNSFKDISRKQVVLINTADGWKILREKSL